MNQQFGALSATEAMPGAGRRLAFFLSFRGSLRKWQEEGILDREILLPLTYIRTGSFDGIDLFTYDARDAALLTTLASNDPAFRHIRTLPAPAYARGKVGGVVYSLLGPIRHRAALKRNAALKTNQISGSWSAIIAKLVTGRPLTLRLGYLLSRRHRLNGKGLAAWVSERVERIGFRVAETIIVTSADAEAHVREIAGPDKVKLLPTYVDPEVFRAKAVYDFTAPVLYVGRFTPQKNLPNLIRACAAIGHQLHLVGAGDQQAELAALADEVGAKVVFLGRIDNTALAARMRDYTIFVLPSFHEGLPKVLIEAMATGLVCVGTNVPGTSDLITDGVTGYLAHDTSPEAIADALRRALSENKTQYGRAAREVIEARFGIEGYARAESALLLAAHTAKP